MKKQRNLFFAAAALLALFIGVSLFLFQRSTYQIKQGYLASEGSAASNFAVLTAKSIRLTDEEVRTLKAYSYRELQISDENQALEHLVNDRNFATNVDYAYVMVHLKPDEVQYQVTAENQERYAAPLGTDLDIMWLLDVNVSDEAQNQDLNTFDDELLRYSYYIKDDARIFGDQPSYIFNASEWGDHICGYAPLYSVEGSYIGAVGVELQTEDFNTYTNHAVQTLRFLMLVSLTLLALVFVIIYYRYQSIQLERSYTDVLTGLQNRTYYNECFIKCMNSRKKSKELFVIMIADIDFFKKVNDTFGHEIGDQVLIEMGNILLNCFDKKQIFRFGGEEFVAGGWVENEAQVKQKMDQLYADVCAHEFTTMQIPITLSAGCSYYPTDKVNGWLVSGMLKAADCKLYECKENGRKQYRIEPFDPKKEYKK